MNPVIRGIVIYLFLTLVFRISGKRSLGEATPFEFILLLIIGEATQQALLGRDFSMTTSMILILTLVGTDLIFSVLKQKSRKFEKITEGVPVILLVNGVPLTERMNKSRISEEDIMESAHSLHGLEKINQIKYAILEVDGSISIIPVEKGS